MMRFALALALSLVMSPVRTGAVRRKGWPDKPIRMIVPLPAGAAVDVVGRLICTKLGERLGQTIVVENRAGACGSARRRRGRQGGARRLHARHGDLDHACHHRHSKRQAALRSGEGFRAGRADRYGALRARRSRRSCRPTISRSCWRWRRPSRSAELFLGRQRQPGASRDRADGARWRASSSTTCLIARPCQAVLDLAEGRIDITFGLLGSILPLHQGRQDPRAGGDHREAQPKTFPMCRPWRKPGCRASKRRSGSRWSAPAALPPALLHGSTARSTRFSPSPR